LDEQDAATLTRAQLLVPWRRFVLHVRAEPEAVMDRLRAQPVVPALGAWTRPNDIPVCTIRGNRVELYAESALRQSVVLECEVTGNQDTVIRILARPTKAQLIVGVPWLGFAAILGLRTAFSAIAVGDPGPIVVLLIPVLGYALFFGRFPALTLRTLGWLNKVVQGG
jgi:hypothetical protein